MRPFFALFMIFLVVFTPFTSAFSTAGDYCSPVADGCSAGSHCSGEEGSFLTTKCCPAGEEYNYYLDVCLEEGEVYVAEEALSNNNQNIVNSEEIISPDSSCYPWEKEADSMCVLSCPDCDSDGDRIKDKVEVRYYANPVIEIDGPAIRSLQKGCLGYYDFSYNQIETFQAEEYNPFSLFNSVPLFGMLSDDPSGPRQLGYGYGIGHGAIASVRDTGKGLLELFIVVPLIQFAPVFAAYKLQKNLPEVVQVLSGDEDVFQQSVDVMSNPLSEGKAEWYERRSDTAMEIKQYDSECDNVILTRRYTFSFVTGYLGAEIAMFFTPEAVVKVASKVRILSKFGKLGELAKAGAKIFSSEGEIKWLDALPSEVGKETAETVARIAAREGNEVARVAARSLSQAVREGVVANTPSAMSKYSEYVAAVSKMERKAVDPLLLENEFKIVKFIEKEGISIKVGDKTVEGAVVLRRGNEAWGWEHVLQRGHNQEIKTAFKLMDNQKSVLDLIQKGIEKGVKSGDSIIWDVPDSSHRLKIVVEGANPGSITTAFPID